MKRIAILSIAMIAVIAMLVKLLYQEVAVTDLMTVIALLGIALAFAIDFLIRRFSKKTETLHEKAK